MALLDTQGTPYRSLAGKLRDQLAADALPPTPPPVSDAVAQRLRDAVGPENRARGIYPQGSGPIVPSASTVDFGPENRARGIHPQTAGAWGNDWNTAPPAVAPGPELSAFTTSLVNNTTPQTLPPASTVGTRQAIAGIQPSQSLMPTAPSTTSGLNMLAAVAAAPARVLAKGIGELPNPLYYSTKITAPGVKTGEGKQIKNADPVTQFVAQSLPYFAAPEAGMAVFAASLPATLQDQVKAYQSGQIDGKQLAVNLGMTLGPLIAPALLKYGVKGAKAAADFAHTPEGKLVLAKAMQEGGGGRIGGGPPVTPGEPTSLTARMTPEQEQAAIAGQMENRIAALGKTGPEGNAPAIPAAGADATLPAPPEAPLPAQGEAGAPVASAPMQPATGGGEPPVPPKPPAPPAGGGELPPEKPPTIPQIEARSKPLTPEQRARIPRDTSRAFFTPATTEQATANAIKSDMDIFQRIQNQMQKIPGVKSIGTYIESIGAAKGQEKLGNSIPMAMVKRDLTVGRQSSEARAGLLAWAGGPEGHVLGIDPNGFARAVEVKPGANVPKQLVGRLDDIIEHPEDYNLTPAQQDALVPIQHTLDASMQHAQAAGVDVHEVAGSYFPRTITGTPKGESATGGGIGNRLTSKPGFAKLRVFPDTRSAVAAGYEVANPMQALGDRLMSGIQATANKEAYKGILDLGVKPSSRIPQDTTQALLDAREAYKIARKSGNQSAIDLAASELDAAKRDLRKAGLRAATPTTGEAKAYGRIFPQSVVNELNKYGDISGQGAIDQFFNIQRAAETTGDHSSLLVQGGNLLYRNPVAWMKAAAYSTMSAAREPWGWVSKNLEAIDAAVKDGAAVPPSEFLLQRKITSGEFGPRVTRPLTRALMTPARAAQRMFEWNVFMGQVEWHKAAVKMGMDAAQRQELGAVIRKGMGSSSMPGVTNAMRNFDKRLWYAGGFMRSTLGLMVDASRGGVRGAEARKTLGMVIGGATSLTIGLQYAVDGTMPNLTDPNRTDKRWGYVEFPGGGVNLYGPLFPYIRFVAKAGQDMQQGNIGGPSDLLGASQGTAAGEVGSLVAGKFALPVRTAIDLRRGETFTGDKIAPGWKGTLDYLAKQAEPLGIRQASEGALSGQLQSFPAQALETIGARTTPNSDYQIAHRALIAAGVTGGLDSGDLGAIADARQKNPAVAQALGNYQFTDYVLQQRAKEAEQKAGMPVADSVFQLPAIQSTFKPLGLDPSGYKTIEDYKAAYIAKYAPAIARADGVSLAEAETRAGDHFEAQTPVQDFKTGMRNAELYFWRQNPKLLDGLVRNGIITPTKAEQAIIDEYHKTIGPAALPVR